MAICAAASQHGIETIDIQHGKQGKYQPMYSGWTRIPSDGYALIPYKFWCWGEPSCKHIMSSCPDRKKHLPFVGGYPWIDYYKNNMTYESHQAVQAKITILFTMQAHIATNIDRIPNFIIDFLTISKSKDIHLIFRIHPNDHDGYTYCQKRLRGINQESYTIDDGKKIYMNYLIQQHTISRLIVLVAMRQDYSISQLYFLAKNLKRYMMKRYRVKYFHGQITTWKIFVNGSHLIP